MKKVNKKIFRGKHGSYKHHGIFPQSGGTAEKVNLHTGHSNRKKTGTLSFIEKINPDGAVKEKICLDFYRILAQSAISRLCLRDEKFIKELLMMHYSATGFEVSEKELSFTIKSLKKYGKETDPRYVTILNKFIDDYSDLGDSFAIAVRERHSIPEFVVKNNTQYPLVGLMTIAAIAKVLDDPDWLGSSAANTGFIIANNQAIAVLVDAGEALSRIYSPEDTLSHSTDSKSIQTSRLSKNHIDFDRLSEKQKDEFIGTIYKFIHCENLKALLEFIIYRNGAFNSEKYPSGKNIVLLSKSESNEMIEKVISNLRTLNETYRQELKAYKEKYDAPDSVPIAEFNIDTTNYSKSTQERGKSHTNSLWWPLLTNPIPLALGIGATIYGLSKWS